MNVVPLSPTSRDPVLLAPERAVTVTGEEHHQDVLAGRSGRVVVALAAVVVPVGKEAGRRRVEVRLDGRRVGELTRLMSERYLPLLDDVTARGRWPVCEAVLKPHQRGVQVELRLPAVDAAARTAVVRAPVVPAPRPAPTAVVPLPGPPAGGPRRGRRVLGASAAVVVVLVLVGALGGGGEPDEPVAGAPTTPAAQAVPTTSTTAASAPQEQTALATTARARATAPSTRTRAEAAAPRTITRTRTTEAAPAPRTRTTTTTAKPAPEQSGSCHPSYSPCLPIGPDLDCPDIGHPVVVKGSDPYRLDRDGNGVGCE